MNFAKRKPSNKIIKMTDPDLIPSTTSNIFHIKTKFRVVKIFCAIFETFKPSLRKTQFKTAVASASFDKIKKEEGKIKKKRLKKKIDMN